MHIITWAHYDTLAEADAVASAITDGGSRGTRAWVEYA